MLVAIVAGGFAIGAVISLLTHRSAGTVALPSGTTAPIARVTLAPAPPPTPVATPDTPPPAEEPTAAPTARPTAKPTAAPTATRAPATPSPSPSAAPSPAATSETTAGPATAAPATARPATPRPATPRPATPRPATPRPVLPTIRPAAVAAAPAKTVAPTPPDGTTEFARQSASVVRAYLSALARGDDTSAESDLDAPAGSRAAQLSEKEFAGPDMRIANVETHGTADGARVDVDIQTPRGAYFAQFFLKKSATGAAVIVSHDFIKP